MFYLFLHAKFTLHTHLFFKETIMKKKLKNENEMTLD